MISDIEQWLPINNFPDYQVSDLGRVKSFKHQKPKILSILPFGRYHGLYLSRDGRKYIKYIHQLVAQAFLGPQLNLDVRHLDGDRSNNCLTNLAYGTRQENMEDALKHGTTARGERLPQSKLTDSKVIELRKLRAEGVTVPKLSEMFGINLRTVYRALTKESWSHI
tara:strand:+ start:308 stop:805 length:498 start_codon:yes stop_codon:yes gene_type:complete